MSRPSDDEHIGENLTDQPDARRTYVRRFRERWSEFYRDDEGEPAEEIATSSPSQPDALPPLDPRRAYVRHFRDRWADYYRQQDEDARSSPVVPFLVRPLIVATFSGTWYVIHLPYGTQWLISGILVALFAAAAGIAWFRGRATRNVEDGRA